MPCVYVSSTEHFHARSLPTTPPNILKTLVLLVFFVITHCAFQIICLSYTQNN